MRHDTRAALRELREGIEAKVASYSSKRLMAYSKHCGAVAAELGEYATALAKIMENDARADEIERMVREDRQDSKT